MGINEFKNRMAYVCMLAMLEDIRYNLYLNRKLTEDEAIDAEIEIINNCPERHVFNLTSCNTKEEAIEEVKFYYNNY